MVAVAPRASRAMIPGLLWCGRARHPMRCPEEKDMAHFLIKAKYTTASVKALIANPQDRQKAAATAIQAAGGKLVSFYMAFGHDDVIAIFEAPDAVTAAAVSMTIGGSGALASVETVPLLTMDEAMAAMKKAPAVQAAYKAPAS
jgi:uncharacterized protein with GYD domain